jgi:hypothetical protein
MEPLRLLSSQDSCSSSHSRRSYDSNRHRKVGVKILLAQTGERGSSIALLLFFGLDSQFVLYVHSTSDLGRCGIDGIFLLV